MTSGPAAGHILPCSLGQGPGTQWVQYPGYCTVRVPVSMPIPVLAQPKESPPSPICVFYLTPVLLYPHAMKRGHLGMVWPSRGKDASGPVRAACCHAWSQGQHVSMHGLKARMLHAAMVSRRPGCGNMKGRSCWESGSSIEALVVKMGKPLYATQFPSPGRGLPLSAQSVLSHSCVEGARPLIIAASGQCGPGARCL